MKIIKGDMGGRYTPPGHDQNVESRSIIKTDTDIHVTTFPPQAGMEEEIHPGHAQVFYVLSGCMSVRQGGMEIGRLKEGDAVYIPAGDPHEVKNDTGEGLIFLAVTYPETSDGNY